MKPNLKDTPTPTDDLTATERRELVIAQTAANILRGLIHEQVADIEDAAAKQAEDGDSDKPPMAKVSVAIEWPAGAQAPAVSVTTSYALRRKSTGTLKADPDQMKLEGMEVAAS